MKREGNNRYTEVIHQQKGNKGDKRKSRKDKGDERLSTETVEGPARALESVDDIKGSDRLALRMFRVGDRVTDNLQTTNEQRAETKTESDTDTLEEQLEHSTRLLVDQSRNTLHTTTTCQPTNSRFCDT